jgi:hypothetical protein
MRTFICGLQRSGTNLQQILTPNAVVWADPYHKHYIKYKDIDPDVDQVLCLIKNPYMWIESICFRSSKDLTEIFHEYYLDSVWHGTEDPEDFIGPRHLYLPRLCLVYKLFYTSWINYEKTRLIHYEDLINSETIIMRVPHSDNWEPNRAHQYVNYQTNHLSNKQIQQITDCLGEDFFNKIGYPIKSTI